MASPENTNWLFDYGLIDDTPVLDGNFAWPVQPIAGSSSASVELDGSLGDAEDLRNLARKRGSELNHAVEQAPRHAGRSCEGIG